jgi:menaquinol-cytochrome c reductase iron-sulfur subunit
MQKREVWVIRHSATSLTVFSPICPHLACRLAWSPDARRFICPCHGSVFSLAGEVLAGPSPRPLDTLPCKTEDGQLLVLWEAYRPGITEKVLA